MTISEPSRRERKKDETRERIFAAAISLFREKGFEATTVDEITEKADVARGTFFNYFPRKEAVFAYMAEVQNAALEEALPGLLRSEDSTSECLARALQFAAEPYAADREMARMLFAEWVKRDVCPPPEAEAQSRRLMHELLERGRSRRELRTDVTDVRVTAIIRGVFLSTLFHWLYCPGGSEEHITDLNAELRVRLEIAMDGLAARKESRA